MRYVQKEFEISGFRLSEAVYPPTLKQPRHTHALASFSFVLAGGYLENYGFRTKAPARQPSTIVFHPPHESHAVDFGSGAKILSVQINSERLAYIRERSIVFDASASSRSETIARLGRRIHQEFRQPDAASALSIEGLIFEILAETARSRFSTHETKSPQWLEAVREFLHENFFESLTIEAIAQIADVHPVHLARVFRNRHGCTIGEYVRRLRVEYAQRQISTSDSTLSEIALAAGFADQSHLNKTFKSLVGLTPYEYRKASRCQRSKKNFVV